MFQFENMLKDFLSVKKKNYDVMQYEIIVLCGIYFRRLQRRSGNGFGFWNNESTLLQPNTARNSSGKLRVEVRQSSQPNYAPISASKN